MELIGEITKVNYGIDETTIEFKAEKVNIEQVSSLMKLSGLKANLNVSKWYKKRSKNSNNYAWELITQIADILRQSKEEVYLDMLKRYGQSQMISVLKEVDVSRFLKYYEQAGESVLNGKDFIHYKVYTGSSEMNTKEMSILIDGIVSEAKELGIETMTPNELKSLKESWK